MNINNFSFHLNGQNICSLAKASCLLLHKVKQKVIGFNLSTSPIFLSSALNHFRFEKVAGLRR